MDDWVAWVALRDVTHHTARATRWRLQRVPLRHLEAVVDRAVAGRTDNPSLLQLLDGPFLRLRGTSLAEAASRLRRHRSLEPEPHHRSRRRCAASAIEHEQSTDTELRSGSTPRLDQVVGHLTSDAPPEIRHLMTLMAERGGSIRYDQNAFEGTALIAMRLGSDLVVSRRWMAAAAQDPAGVYATVTHEIGGHLFYGATLGCLIAMEAFGSVAESGAADFGDMLQTYSYPETEVYAELKELDATTDVSIGDDPHTDVPRRLAALRQAYPHDVATLVIDWMRFRFERDATLSPEALALFESAVAHTR